MKITVVALGKIGLPLAVQIASRGHIVSGCDVNQAVVDAVNEGRAPFPGEADLDTKLAEVVARGSLRATTDTTQAVAESAAVVVVVPLFVDDQDRPDFRSIDEATKVIGKGLQPGTVVSYETTLPIGTTRTRFAPILAAESGLDAGDDFFVVFSPERVLTGRVFSDLRRYPKLVGGLDDESTKRGVALYEDVLDFDERPDLPQPNGVWNVGTAEAAEFAKLAETTYRDVNIGLANQFARFADRVGVDIYQVIAASNSQPYSNIHRPGIAVGGHCIPIYPRLYLWNDPDATVVQAARATNASMPDYAVSLLKQALDDLAGLKVVVLGAAYRGGVKETAFSGVFPTVEALAAAGAHASVHDPLYTDDELLALGLFPYHLGEPVDAAIVQADHAEYATLTSDRLPGLKVLLDGRNITNPAVWRGITRRVIGSPT